jgi:glyoxylase-like metal-dependent hydrolase (beta-lactamase superfamily II)
VKKIILFLGCFFICFYLYAQRPPLKISHLTGDFYVYTTYKDWNGTPFPSNSMYVVTDSGVILIDTPWDIEQTEPLLDSIRQRHGKEVKLCVVTHFHDDRTIGLDVLKSHGVSTFSTQFTDSLSARQGNPRALYTFSGDTTFRLGNYSFQTFYPGRGHAPDNIVVWFPAEKVLYGGCFVKSTEAGTLGNMGDADLQAWKISAHRVKNLYGNARYIIPGHQGWQSRNSLKHTIKLIDQGLQK